ncbi:class II aldolase/adducin family protein [Caballeronia sp. SEWSISQ10-4 2]|jgi:ribulose-5-phosphate 4-epimerase/fuculose-1-phosphate aldolase|uniref:class II aldolase/adducin family protein n=1 Tax=Caballeronia sp. SEWSISQ10-4 2 TaxID=2937438 RepID=UPI00264BD8E0|nr:class II aldolase/adducin family protein [Caballeronia sp. SEWSISQ10-4 2]MDN7177033.1 class II aldolase/adducin family protein [Caballeronia sp. SEWSISQ10-4 2]
MNKTHAIGDASALDWPGAGPLNQAQAVGAADDDAAAQEWRVRVDLAACYRLVELFGWSDLVGTHISARVPGHDHAFLINPFGMTFDEITATSLIKIDLEGNVIGESSYYGVNKAGFVIHSAVHQVRDDANCVMHLHTVDSMAVSALSEGLLPLNQTAMLTTGDLALHDYEGPALHLDERERLQRDLGDKHLMLLRNHGTLAVGASVSEAFVRMFMLQRACSAQVRTLSMGRPLHEVSAAARASTEAMGTSATTLSRYGQLAWPALLRKLDREMPGYDS